MMMMNDAGREGERVLSCNSVRFPIGRWVISNSLPEENNYTYSTYILHIAGRCAFRNTDISTVYSYLHKRSYPIPHE